MFRYNFWQQPYKLYWDMLSYWSMDWESYLSLSHWVVWRNLQEGTLEARRVSRTLYVTPFQAKSMKYLFVRRRMRSKLEMENFIVSLEMSSAGQFHKSQKSITRHCACFFFTAPRPMAWHTKVGKREGKKTRNQVIASFFRSDSLYFLWMDLLEIRSVRCRFPYPPR